MRWRRSVPFLALIAFIALPIEGAAQGSPATKVAKLTFGQTEWGMSLSEVRTKYPGGIISKAPLTGGLFSKALLTYSVTRPAFGVCACDIRFQFVTGWDARRWRTACGKKPEFLAYVLVQCPSTRKIKDAKGCTIKPGKGGMLILRELMKEYGDPMPTDGRDYMWRLEHNDRFMNERLDAYWKSDGYDKQAYTMVTYSGSYYSLY